METKKIKELATRNETAERILRMIAERRRNTVYTAFSGLRADLKARDQKEVNRKEFDATFEALEKLGAGEIEKSQRGVYKGFMWKEPIRNVGDVFKKKDDVPETVKVETDSGDYVTVIIMKNEKAIKTLRVPERNLLDLE